MEGTQLGLKDLVFGIHDESGLAWEETETVSIVWKLDFSVRVNVDARKHTGACGSGIKVRVIHSGSGKVPGLRDSEVIPTKVLVRLACRVIIKLVNEDDVSVYVLQDGSNTLELVDIIGSSFLSELAFFGEVQSVIKGGNTKNFSASKGG